MKNTVLQTVGITLLVIAVASCRKEDAGGIDAVQNSKLSGSQSAISDAQKHACLNWADSGYLKTSAEGSTLEVILGEVAQTHASAQVVKDFGQRMITDHTREHKEVKQVAASVGLTVPDEPSAEGKEVIKELSTYSGSDFDKHYISYEVEDHRTDIKDATKEIFYGRNEKAENLAI